MIFLYHNNAEKKVNLIRNGEILKDYPNRLVACLWQLCSDYPEELIIWMDNDLDIEPAKNLEKIFEHSLIMASCPVKNYEISDEIGYVDQLPFVNPERNSKYPTWRMSTDIGGIFGKTAIQFKSLLSEIENFGYLINSIAKIGQQNSLFCYSDSALIQNSVESFQTKTDISALFRFTAQHYKKVRLVLLFLCFIKYERKFPIFHFLKNCFRKSYFQKQINLQEIQQISTQNVSEETIDVIIPTLNRPEHLKNVLKDLHNQHKLPEQVIIVEQNQDENSESQLPFINSEEWPFKIVHHFTHRIGACHARNMALKNVKSEWIFFADDDIRFEADLLKNSLAEAERLKTDALNLNCIQPHEKTVFSKVKQWGAFGSGTSIVKSEYALKCRFSEAFEQGFGEDIDFGMQLRKVGCDIIYHPNILITHLKAERGGFREFMSAENLKTSNIQPKPSPTMMFLVQKYFNFYMQKGYKMNLFIKFFGRQLIKNPFLYYRTMQKRWKLSENLSRKLKNSDSN